MNRKIMLIAAFIAAAVQAQPEIKIIKAENNTKQNIMLSSTTKNVVVSPESIQKMLMSVPYHELQTYLADYAQGKPYKPLNVVKLVTHAGTFFLWVDHRGVIVAQEFKMGSVSRAEAMPQVLLAFNEQKASAAVLGYLVTVNKDGRPAISQVLK